MLLPGPFAPPPHPPSLHSFLKVQSMGVLLQEAFSDFLSWLHGEYGPSNQAL